MSGRTIAAIVLATVFFAGAATALGVLRLVERRHEPYTAVGRPPFPDDPHPRLGEPSVGPRRAPPFFDGSRRYTDMARTRVTERMARALRLTDEQRDAIEEAMERSRVAAQDAMAEVLPRLQSRLDSLNAQIDRILTEDQREAFREFRRRDRDRFRREGSRWFRGPGRNGRR